MSHSFGGPIVECLLCGETPAIDLESGRRFCRQHGTLPLAERVPYPEQAPQDLKTRCMRLLLWHRIGKRMGGQPPC